MNNNNPILLTTDAKPGAEMHGLPAPVQLGQYQIAASALPLDGGRFGAAVLIGNAGDAALPDHEIHFRDEFPTRAAAAYFAMSHGLRWAFKSLRAGPSGAFA